MNLKNKKIFYINLDKHQERRQRIESFFEKHNFTDVTRIPGVLDENPIVGCAKAYLNVFEEAPDCDFIILEDDCVPTSFFDPEFDMKPLGQYDAVYLGASLFARRVSYSDPRKIESEVLQSKIFRANERNTAVYMNRGTPEYADSGYYLSFSDKRPDGTRKINNMLSTHAIYYSSKRFVDLIANEIDNTLMSPKPVHIDCLFAEQGQKRLDVSVLNEPLFFQSSSENATNFSFDNYEEKLEYDLKSVFGDLV